MSHKLLTLLAAGICLLAGMPGFAQDAPDTGTPRTFHLLREEDLAKRNREKEESTAKAWEPRLQEHQIQVGLSLGQLDLNQVVFSQDQIIYKYDKEATYWGDVDIKGGSAFNPVVHLGYSLSRWFTLEAVGGLSFSQYQSTIVNRQRRENKINSKVDLEEPALGEYDAEARSLLTVQLGANAMVYPFDIRGDGRGRIHPYLTAGLGRVWYDMNSSYNDGSSGTNDLNFGGGIRLLADRTISIRLEVLMHVNSLQWQPEPNFQVLDGGTVLVPMEEFPLDPETRSYTEQVVTSYDTQDLSTLSISLGFLGSF